MSLAFGWFLLIVIGHLEVVVAKGGLNFPFYYAIFLDISNLCMLPLLLKYLLL